MSKDTANFFLATTAIEEFWDKSKKIVFLGPWCIASLDKYDYEGSAILDTPYDEPGIEHQLFNQIEKKYETILPILASRLNEIHNVRYSLRYWRILIGPWLYPYLCVTYDRFLHIKKALNDYPGIATKKLAESSFVIPKNTLDFACYINDDQYNLQLVSEIFSALNLNYPSQEFKISSSILYKKLSSFSLKRSIFGFLSLFILRLSNKFNQVIVMKNSYFPKKEELFLLFKTRLRVVPIWNINKELNVKNDFKKRDELLNLEVGKSEYDRCLEKIIYKDIPQCFVETFQKIESVSHITYPRKVKAIFSANAWYYDEPFKQWAARQSEEGVHLIGTQHGGSYGGLLNMPSENHELNIVDKYFTWGWVRDGFLAKTLPMPATKLLNRKKVCADNNKTGVLWAATSLPRYLTQYPILPKDFQDYLSYQRRFCKSLNITVANNLRFRPHYQNDGWDINKRIKAILPDVAIESWDVPFHQSLLDCRIYVCDHFSTTFAEALAINKPTILFWNSKNNTLRPEALSYYELLVEVGILFDNPEAAAEALNLAYNDVEIWWNDQKRQKAIESFCLNFARNSKSGASFWKLELEELLDS